MLSDAIVEDIVGLCTCTCTYKKQWCIIQLFLLWLLKTRNSITMVSILGILTGFIESELGTHAYILRNPLTTTRVFKPITLEFVLNATPTICFCCTTTKTIGLRNSEEGGSTYIHTLSLAQG